MSKTDDISECVKREILSGKYDGSPFPSEGMLTRRFKVSRTPVRAALEKLERDGLILRRQGAPTKLTRYARNATGTLGLVIPGVSYAEIFKLICTEFRKIAENAGWKVLFGEVKSPDPKIRAREVRRMAYQFSKNHVAGVVLQPLEFLRNASAATQEVISFFDKASIPTVLLDYDFLSMPGRSRYDLVGIDNIGAGYSLGCHLLKVHARKITFLRRPNSAPTNDDRLYGLVRAVLESGGSWTSADNVLRAWPDDTRRIDRFIKTQRPDTIVCGNDFTAGCLMNTLKKLGISVPGDIMVAGVDDVAAETFDPPLTTCRQPCEDLAAVAFETLLGRIRNPASPIRTIRLPAPLVVRASTTRK